MREDLGLQLDLVDVFGVAPLCGNPLAVVRGGQGLDAAQMLRLTQWLGFSETTFLLPPTDIGADYRVRIFYPGGELPFAGHPTLGSAFAWLNAGGQPRRPSVVVQQCDAGLIEVRLEDERLAFAAPPFTRDGPMSDEEVEAAARLTGVPLPVIEEGVHVANGPRWQLLRLKSAAAVLEAQPQARAPLGTDIGLAGPHEPGGHVAWELRAFFTNQHGALVEDPVTGSFNAGVAMHLFNDGSVQGRYVAGQGQVTGADGRVYCERDQAGRVWIGGNCAMIAQGAAVRLSA